MKVEIPSQHRVLGRYGTDAQAMVHCEELAELIQAISKMRRARNGGQDDAEAYDNLVEEMADVLWPVDGPHALLRNIPQTIIFIASKA